MTRSFAPHRLIPRLAAVVTALCVFAGGAARADSLWVSSALANEGGEVPAGKLNALEISKIRITQIDDTAATFANPAGRETMRDAKTVVRIAIDDETALNTAEEAYVNGKWDAATDGYVKTIKSTKRDWLKEWVARRLLVAAQKANRFDAAATAYIAAVLSKGARPDKPALPDAKSTYLATAASEVQAALQQSAKLSPDQRQALLSFLLDLHRARNDQKGIAEVTQQLVKTGAQVGNDPAAAGAVARMKLDLAAVAVDGKQYKKAIDEINGSRGVFVDPKDQAAALYVLAQAQEGLAGEDATALADAALAYMRVVAHFKDAPGRPNVVNALMRTASIMERTKNDKAALELYRQVAAQYADDPAAAEAQKNAKRLGAQPQTPIPPNETGVEVGR